MEAVGRLCLLEACPGLQDLEVFHHVQKEELQDTDSKQSSTAAPSVLDAAAQHAPGLRYLQICSKVLRYGCAVDDVKQRLHPGPEPTNIRGPRPHLATGVSL